MTRFRSPSPYLAESAAFASAVVTLLTAVLTQAAETDFAPAAGDDFPTEVFWGDTHVHSSFSVDANSMGNTRLSPADAYRFAKGEAVVANNGMTARLEAPLDFLVVSDHAEYMGLLPALRAGNEALLSDPVGRRLSEAVQGDQASQYAVIQEIIGSLMASAPIIDNADFKQSIWNEITRLADEANEPGRFSAMIGYEWSAMPSGDNLHRVVVYRDGANEAKQKVPRSSFEGEDPESLWAFMEDYVAETGGDILAIPHNPNMSNGQMFALEQSDGRAFDRAYADRRSRHEPIAEITQIKGDSEAHPLLSPDDAFADFENWDTGNIGTPATPKKDEQLQYEYLRQAFKHGLGEEARLGVNPFKMGVIGSTDAHTSLATGAENDYWGKLSVLEPGPGRLAPPPVQEQEESGIYPWSWVASGYAAAWARENTRAAIFDAMRRREVYATTGSRITLRFFGGWDYTEDEAFRSDLVRRGYRGGVPMGGDLAPRKGEDAKPRFLIRALKDPNGANLDRIQIVKGWRTADGILQEEVHDVALGGEGRRGLFGIREVGSTVNAEDATYTNSIGAAELSAWWVDEDFDAQEHAFYYARVIEIPTPRWSTYDSVRFDVSLDPRAPRSVQDRAYASPIWYAPPDRR
ncbi:MAG: hypothetical protein CL931_00485 [Deltaproteobacteria bacterium]|nr:hypothetical protein [Deltaproteobacteria bacterium]